MRAARLLAMLIAYFATVGVVAGLLLGAYPEWQARLPIGGAQHLITQPAGASEGANALAPVAKGSLDKVGSIGASLGWMFAAIIAAFLAALPVSWVYMRTRTEEEYDQSLVSTVLVLPVIVTSVVIIVQNSLSLAFALAGIAGAVRFKNSLKSSGDALYILLSVGIGLAAGTGASELAYVMSLAFCIGFTLLWLTEYGEKAGMKRYMSDFDPSNCPPTTVAGPVPSPPPPPQPPAQVQ